jgi:hypothetical protein
MRANGCTAGSCTCHGEAQCAFACNPLYIPGAGLPRCAPL